MSICILIRNLSIDNFIVHFEHILFCFTRVEVPPGAAARVAPHPLVTVHEVPVITDARVVHLSRSQPQSFPQRVTFRKRADLFPWPQDSVGHHCLRDEKMQQRMLNIKIVT